MTYEINVAGLKRTLPLCRLSDDTYIAAFIIFGDVEMTIHCANKLLALAPEFDCLIAPEAKSIPLVYEMSRQSGKPYFLARKSAKLYMNGTLEVTVKSITTAADQRLVISSADAGAMRGKRLLLVDDVISTGDSLRGLEALVERAGGVIAGRAAILAEGEASERGDVAVLAKLPLFDGTGAIKAC